MGFATAFSTLATTMISNAAGFVSDFGPVMAGLVGIALGGYALVQIRRFIG